MPGGEGPSWPSRSVASLLSSPWGRDWVAGSAASKLPLVRPQVACQKEEWPLGTATRGKNWGGLGTHLLVEAGARFVPLSVTLLDPQVAGALRIVATDSPQSEAGASVTEHSAAGLRPLAMPGLAVIRMAWMIGSDRENIPGSSGSAVRMAKAHRSKGRPSRSQLNGAARESNPPSRGLHDRTGFEDPLGHRAHAAPSGRLDHAPMARGAPVAGGRFIRPQARTPVELLHA
jgi:hypothetical protein